MKHFFVISNESKDKNFEVAQKIREYLESRQCTCVIAKDYGKDSSKNFSTDVREIPEHTQAVIVLGGDGTLLQAANDIAEVSLPILGVNLGTLGFLTDIEKHQIYRALDRLIANDYATEERMLLEGVVIGEGTCNAHALALNDIVINKGRFYHLVSVKVYINDELLDQYIADGIIVSSPTGSTGYNLSAGGPVMVPSMEGIIITPICPHSLNNRSLVVSPKDEVVLEISPTRDDREDEGILIIDGMVQGVLKNGQKVCIRKAKDSTTLIKLSKNSFFEVFHDKLGINQENM